jgi:hypothetical protein
VWKIGTHVDYRGVARILVNGILSGAVLWMMKPLFASAVGVVLSIPVFVVLYIAANLAFRAFAPAERDLINSKLPYPLWRF